MLARFVEKWAEAELINIYSYPYVMRYMTIMTEFRQTLNMTGNRDVQQSSNFRTSVSKNSNSNLISIHLLFETLMKFVHYFHLVMITSTFRA